MLTKLLLKPPLWCQTTMCHEDMIHWPGCAHYKLPLNVTTVQNYNAKTPRKTSTEETPINAPTSIDLKNTLLHELF